MSARTYPHCCGDCAQGRRYCPTPQACQMPEPGSREIPTWVLAVLLVLTVMVVLFVAP